MDIKLTKSQRKAVRKQQQKEKRRVKRQAENKAKRLATQTKRKELLNSMTTEERRAFILKEREEQEKSKQELTQRLTLNKESGDFHVAIALDFMHQMSEAEAQSLAKQIQWIWNEIVRTPKYTVKFDLCSFEPSSAFETLCRKFGFVNWIMNMHSSHFTDVYSDKNIILLSPDASEPLTEDEIRAEKTVFVIGGLVDKTVKKNVTKNVAEEHGTKCRRLPIAELGRSINPILNINTVFTIIANVRFNDRNLPEAINECIPIRKQDLNNRLSRKQRRSNQSSSSCTISSGEEEEEDSTLA